MRASRVSAFFFGPASEPRYGVLHTPPNASVGPTGVVLCGPFASERNETIRSVRRLAGALSDAGLATLRFDASGTGDSWGEVTDDALDAWHADIPHAIDALRDRTGAARVVVIGVRWGGTLAWSQRMHPAVCAVGLWAPVVDGAAYVSSLRQAHREWLAVECEQRPGARRFAGSHEALGAALPVGLATAMQHISLTPDPAFRRPVGWFASPDEPAPSALAPSMHRVTLHDPPVWATDSGMEAPPVATEAIRHIVAWAQEVP